MSGSGGKKGGGVSRSSTEDPGCLEFNEMGMVKPTFRHRRFIWMCKPYVSVVLFYSGLYLPASLSDIHLTTFAGYAVNPGSP